MLECMWVCFQKHSFFSSSIKSIIERERGIWAQILELPFFQTQWEEQKKWFSESSFLEEEEESVLSTYKLRLSSPLLDDDDDDLHSFVSLTLQISRVGPFLLNERTQNTQDQKEMKALPHTRRDSNNHSKRTKKKKTRKYAFASLSDEEDEEEEEEEEKGESKNRLKKNCEKAFNHFCKATADMDAWVSEWVIALLCFVFVYGFLGLAGYA